MDQKEFSQILSKNESKFVEAWEEICKKWDYYPKRKQENEADREYYFNKLKELKGAFEKEEVEIFLQGLRREGGFLADSGTTLEDLLKGISIFTEIIYDFVLEDFKENPDELYEKSKDLFDLRSKIFIESSLGFEIAKDDIIQDQRVELEHLVVTDPLTGLYNHSYLYHQIKIETLRSERYKHKLVVLIADIDDFKEYNDINGHLKGDEVIRKIASIMFEESRASDLVGRYAGEEFIVLLPETNLEQVKKYAERVHKVIKQTHFDGMETQPKKRISISIGYAVFPDHAKNVDELLHKADLAVDLAKAQEIDGTSSP